MQSEKEMQGNGLFVDVPLEVGNRDLRHVTQMCWFTQALAGSQEESVRPSLEIARRRSDLVTDGAGVYAAGICSFRLFHR